MTEKRKYVRYECKILAKFDFYEGDPNKIDIDNTVPHKGTGYILDLSSGGLLLATNDRVGIDMPIKINFFIKDKGYDKLGKIIRTGLIKDNPSDVAKEFAGYTNKGDLYIAMKFDHTVDIIPENIE